MVGLEYMRSISCAWPGQYAVSLQQHIYDGCMRYTIVRLVGIVLVVSVLLCSASYVCVCGHDCELNSMSLIMVNMQQLRRHECIHFTCSVFTDAWPWLL